MVDLELTVKEGRARIDEVDRRVSALLEERAAIVRAVGRAKREAGLPRRDGAREAEIVAGYSSRARLADPGAAEIVAAAVLEATRCGAGVTITIVGQAPGPSGGEPFRGRSGARLAALMGLASVEELADRANLVNVLSSFPGKARAGKGDAFPLERARRAARRMRLAGTILFAGKGVARAFGIGGAEYFEWRAIDAATTAAVIPHPSGVSRWWNEPGNEERARAFLRAAML